MHKPALQIEDESDPQPFSAEKFAMKATAQPLRNEDRDEVLSFLDARPIHTVFTRSFIYDNGIESDFNRGTFYGCRNQEGHLEGVALIGHATLVEAASVAAIEAFAQLAQECTSAHMILGEQETVAQFWNSFAQAGHTPRRVCR